MTHWILARKRVDDGYLFAVWLFNLSNLQRNPAESAAGHFNWFFTTRLVLGSVLFLLVIGGDRVLVSMIYTMVSDSTYYQKRRGTSTRF